MMPNLKGVNKRVEISAKRTKTNSTYKGAMKSAIKKAAQTANVEDLKDMDKTIDKALKKGIIKKNAAARKKSRIAKKINKAK